jgi:hypothetical protein
MESASAVSGASGATMGSRESLDSSVSSSIQQARSSGLTRVRLMMHARNEAGIGDGKVKYDTEYYGVPMRNSMSPQPNYSSLPSYKAPGGSAIMHAESNLSLISEAQSASAAAIQVCNI